MDEGKRQRGIEAVIAVIDPDKVKWLRNDSERRSPDIYAEDNPELAAKIDEAYKAETGKPFFTSSAAEAAAIYIEDEDTAARLIASERMRYTQVALLSDMDDGVENETTVHYLGRNDLVGKWLVIISYEE